MGQPYLTTATARLTLHDLSKSPIRDGDIMHQPQPEMESLFDMATKDRILIEMGTAIGKIDGTLTAWTERLEEHNERLTRILEKADQRDDEIEAKADRANSRIDAATNKALGIGIGSALGGGSLGAFLMKLFH